MDWKHPRWEKCKHEPGVLYQGGTNCRNSINTPYSMTHECWCLGYHNIGKVGMARAQFVVGPLATYFGV